MSKEMRGRPLNGREKMLLTSFPIHPSKLQAITKIAKRRGQTRASLLRELIDQCIAV